MMLLRLKSQYNSPTGDILFPGLYQYADADLFTGQHIVRLYLHDYGDEMVAVPIDLVEPLTNEEHELWELLHGSD